MRRGVSNLWKMALLMLPMLGSVEAARALNINHIVATSDLRRIGASIGEYSVYQADSLNIDLYCIGRAGAHSLTDANLNIAFYVVNATNWAQVSIQHTGAVANATNGYVTVNVAPSNTVLATNDYVGLISAYVRENGTNYDRGTLARMDLKWLYSPAGGNYTTTTPIDFSMYITGGYLSAPQGTGAISVVGRQFAITMPEGVIGDGTNDMVEWSEISGIVGTGAQNVAQGTHTHAYVGIETDPVFSASTAYSIDGADTNAWWQGYLLAEAAAAYTNMAATAYGWGDHSTNGYLTEETLWNAESNNVAAGIASKYATTGGPISGLAWLPYARVSNAWNAAAPCSGAYGGVLEIWGRVGGAYPGIMLKPANTGDYALTFGSPSIMFFCNPTNPNGTAQASWLYAGSTDGNPPYDLKYDTGAWADTVVLKNANDAALTAKVSKAGSDMSGNLGMGGNIISNIGGGGGSLTGTPLYAESDPIWTAASGGVRYAATLINSQDIDWTSAPFDELADGDDLGVGGSTNLSEFNNDVPFATGTPLYVFTETDPVWTNERAGYMATGSVVSGDSTVSVTYSNGVTDLHVEISSASETSTVFDVLSRGNDAQGLAISNLDLSLGTNVSLAELDRATNFVKKTGDTMTGNLNLGAQVLTNWLSLRPAGDEVIIGLGANAVSDGVAIGLNANAYNNNVAIGKNANGYGTGGENVAIGLDSYAAEGTAVGAYSRADNQGSCIGRSANGANWGTALGYGANGNVYGAAVGNNANANSYGAALGASANAYRLSVAIGRSAEASYSNIAVGALTKALGTYRTAIGYNVSNSVDNSAAIRGTLYLDGGTGVFVRTTFGTGAWRGLYDDGTNIFYVNATGAVEQITGL